MHNFQELIIWKKAMKVTVDVYRLSAKFPKEEKYGLTSQIRRSAISVPSNIAEGAGRNSNKEFRHFLGISSGSANELHSQLLLSNRLDLVSNEEVSPIIDQLVEVQKNNYSLIKKFTK
ncbi:MAG: four helix bundle protein [Flavobacteriaceae bacterium]